MNKEFKIEMIVSFKASHWPLVGADDKAQQFVTSLFHKFKYRSMIAEVNTIQCEVTDMEDLE